MSIYPGRTGVLPRRQQTWTGENVSEPVRQSGATDAVAPAERRGVTEPLIAAGVVVAGAAFVGLVVPRFPGLVPACPSQTLFGVWCPLCGGTRAANALVSGRLSDAVGFNVLVPVLAVLVGWSWFAWFGRASERFRLPTVPRWVWASLAVVALVFGVLRNLPFEPFASWAP
jgi:hypothetical protein